MKYITGIYRDLTDRRKFVDTHMAIIFPNTAVHADMEHVFIKTISAGFCNIHNHEGDFEVNPYGRSESLGVNSDVVNDRKLLRIALEFD